MSGMMRSRVTGCLCPDCTGGWHKDRAQEKREWRKQVTEESAEPTKVFSLTDGAEQ